MIFSEDYTDGCIGIVPMMPAFQRTGPNHLRIGGCADAKSFRQCLTAR
jgi:hypothetical protein